MTRTQLVLVGGSIALHLGVWAWMGLLPKERKTNAVAIALAESKKKAEEKKPPPPPPPPPPAVQPQKAKVAAPAPKPAPVEAPPPVNAPPPPVGDAPAAMDGFADLGLSMTGGNGMAVPTGGGGRGAAPAQSAKPVTKQVKALAPVADDCTEDPVKPQLASQVQPSYTSEGRQANVEGVVKLEISVDDAGRVTSVRVLKGLGFGLDEAAVAAAKQWTFKPATRCGKAVPYVVKPAVRFQLGS